ncbi:hypothetical protein J4217_04270 [Candidatus Pacearchaeota archaeon]|nr:hypothetical protein [Candidatus Pacearchaeota archaeon]
MVLLKSYHAGKIIQLRDRHPEVDAGRIKDDYFFCLKEGVSSMLKGVHAGTASLNYIDDVLATVESTPMRRVRNFFFAELN